MEAMRSLFLPALDDFRQQLPLETTHDVSFLVDAVAVAAADEEQEDSGYEYLLLFFVVLLLVSFFLSVSLSLFPSFSFVMSTKVGEDGQGVVGFSTTFEIKNHEDSQWGH